MVFPGGVAQEDAGEEVQVAGVVHLLERHRISFNVGLLRAQAGLYAEFFELLAEVEVRRVHVFFINKVVGAVVVVLPVAVPQGIEAELLSESTKLTFRPALELGVVLQRVGIIDLRGFDIDNGRLLAAGGIAAEVDLTYRIHVAGIEVAVLVLGVAGIVQVDVEFPAGRVQPAFVVQVVALAVHILAVGGNGAEARIHPCAIADPGLAVAAPVPAVAGYIYHYTYRMVLVEEPVDAGFSAMVLTFLVQVRVLVEHDAAAGLHVVPVYVQVLELAVVVVIVRSVNVDLFVAVVQVEAAVAPGKGSLAVGGVHAAVGAEVWNSFSA